MRFFSQITYAACKKHSAAVCKKHSTNCTSTNSMRTGGIVCEIADDVVSEFADTSDFVMMPSWRNANNLPRPLLDKCERPPFAIGGHAFLDDGFQRRGTALVYRNLQKTQNSLPDANNNDPIISQKILLTLLHHAVLVILAFFQN